MWFAIRRRTCDNYAFVGSFNALCELSTLFFSRFHGFDHIHSVKTSFTRIFVCVCASITPNCQKYLSQDVCLNGVHFNETKYRNSVTNHFVLPRCLISADMDLKFAFVHKSGRAFD